MSLGADSVTVKSRSVAPTSPSSALASATDASATSSLTITPVATARPNPALTGALNVRVKVSSPSGLVSPSTGTETVSSVSPGANRSSPLAAR